MGAASLWRSLNGLVVMGGFVAAGWALEGPPAGYLHGSIYPSWSWALVAVGALAGTVLLLAPASAQLVDEAAACVAFLVGALLTGTAVLARLHWQFGSGIRSYGAGQLAEVERLAVIMALAAGVATLAAALLLALDAVDRRHHQRHQQPSRHRHHHRPSAA